MATLSEASAHLFISTTRFREFIDQGVLTQALRASYDLDLVRKEYIHYMRSERSGQAKGTGGIGLSLNRAALAHEQTIAAQLKNAAARGDLVSLVAVQKVFMGWLAVFRERILTAPGKMADPLAMRTREEIEPLLRAELNEALDELHDPTTIGDGGDREDVSGILETVEAAAESQPDRVV